MKVPNKAIDLPCDLFQLIRILMVKANMKYLGGIVMKRELQADVVIIGGGTGGIAAALGALKSGKRVIMTEETEWIGGQLTSQAVPPDEHPWIEQFGCTATYRQFRNQVRKYYQAYYPLTEQARQNPALNPGGGWVSRLCYDPRVAVNVLENMLAPYLHSTQLTLLKGVRPLSAVMLGDTIVSITVSQLQSGDEYELTAPYFLDASECGDVLPLTDTEYVTGAESQADTGEPHAVVGPAQPDNMQAFTHCFAMEHVEGEDFTIEKPQQYEFWKNYQADFWPAKQLSMMGLVPYSLQPIEYGLFEGSRPVSLFSYRQIVKKSHLASPAFQGDVSLVNWPQNDYWLGSIIDTDEAAKQKHLEAAKQLSLSLLYWLQTEIPRADDKQGYPGLRLRPDMMGTSDGLAMSPYIRESRRIKAQFTVLEQHVATACRPNGVAEQFDDSVGIGCYRIDLHPSTGGDNFIDVSTVPFQIPLGSLIPIRVTNLIAAGKNIGVTHITNGCYRLHPVEWNIGEAAGYLAAYCLDKQTTPIAVHQTLEQLHDYQARLVLAGIELKWPTLRPV